MPLSHHNPGVGTSSVGSSGATASTAAGEECVPPESHEPVSAEEMDALVAQLSSLATRMTEAQRFRVASILRWGFNSDGAAER